MPTPVVIPEEDVIASVADALQHIFCFRPDDDIPPGPGAASATTRPRRPDPRAAVEGMPWILVRTDV
jgi:hypothetical protein